ncbi:MAG: ATP synthase subunit I [Oscillospiraceae bacterium]
MNDKDFNKECLYLFKGSCILNAIIFVISLILKMNISVLVGLLLGTGILFINLNLLRRDLDNAIKYGNNKARLMCGYLLRYLLIGCAFYFATKVKIINPCGVIIPLFYPRVLYTLKSIINNKKERSC